MPFTWDITTFGDYDLLIKLYYRQENMQKVRGQKNHVGVTFWGTEFFKSVDDNEVRYGEHVDSYI